MGTLDHLGLFTRNRKPLGDFGYRADEGKPISWLFYFTLKGHGGLGYRVREEMKRWLNSERVFGKVAKMCRQPGEWVVREELVI